MKNMNVLILIIEDDKYMNETLSEVLKDEGYTVDATTNAVDAVNKIKLSGKEYQLLVLDYNLQHLQGITGLDIYNIAKKDNPQIKAIMISAYGKEKDIKNRAKSMGVDMFIEKPFMITDLVDAVDELSRGNFKNHQDSMMSY